MLAFETKPEALTLDSSPDKRLFTSADYDPLHNIVLYMEYTRSLHAFASDTY